VVSFLLDYLGLSVFNRFTAHLVAVKIPGFGRKPRQTLTRNEIRLAELAWIAEFGLPMCV
jgi:hypothetical protein